MAVEEEWYVAEIVGGNLYYPASSTDGKQVIYRVDLSAEVKTEGEGDEAYNYIDGEVKAGVLTEAEELTIFDEKIEKLTGTVSYDADGEIALEEKIVDAKATYDELLEKYGAMQITLKP